MNQKECSSILDNMVERAKGDWSLYMNIHKMKTEVYTIISEEGEIKEKDFVEIYQKYIKESQRDSVKDLIREVSLNQIGI